MSTSIKVNAITTAINAMCDGFLSFDAACATVREYRMAEQLDADTARGYVLAALLSKKAAYRTQLTDNGKPAQGTALKAAVTRLMRYTDPDYQAKADTSEQKGVTKAGKKLSGDQKALKEYMAAIVAELMEQGWTKTDIKAAI